TPQSPRRSSRWSPTVLMGRLREDVKTGHARKARARLLSSASFPRMREPMVQATNLGPRLRGGDNAPSRSEDAGVASADLHRQEDARLAALDEEGGVLAGLLDEALQLRHRLDRLAVHPEDDVARAHAGLGR